MLGKDRGWFEGDEGFEHGRWKMIYIDWRLFLLLNLYFLSISHLQTKYIFVRLKGFKDS